MNNKRFRLLLTAAVMTTAALTGCGQSGDTTAATQAQSISKPGIVSVSATFPGAGSAIKSLIPAGTQKIEVYASSNPNAQYYYPGMPTEQMGTLIASLTPTEPQKTVRMLPGNYYIGAYAFDSTDAATRRLLSVAMSGGTVVEGNNSVELTFAEGIWTITDANGGALTLTDGTVIKDMVIGGTMDQQGMYKKSAIDYTRPAGYASGMVRYRFANNTSARTYGGMMSQFNGTTKTNRLYSDMYNVTRRDSKFYNYSTYTERKGDHLIVVTSDPADNGGSYDYYEGVKQGSATELLPNKGQTSFSKDMTAMFSETSFTNGKTISGSLLEIVATTDKTAAIKTSGVTAAKSVAGAIKSASANTTLSGVTVTDTQYVVFNLNGGTNKGGWSLHEARQTSDGKTYYYSGQLQPTYSVDPVTHQYTMSYNAGDYSYGLVPTTTDLGEYCHVFDWSTKTCTQRKPSTGDIYYPYNFYDLDGNGVINYGSFKFQFYAEEIQTYDVFKYMFTATGK